MLLLDTKKKPAYTPANSKLQELGVRRCSAEPQAQCRDESRTRQVPEFQKRPKMTDDNEKPQGTHTANARRKYWRLLGRGIAVKPHDLASIIKDMEAQDARIITLETENARLRESLGKIAKHPTTGEYFANTGDIKTGLEIAKRLKDFIECARHALKGDQNVQGK